jgi:hypothetical protein
MSLTTKQKYIGGSILSLGVIVTGVFTYRHFKKKGEVTRQDKAYTAATKTVGGTTVNVIETARQIGMDLGIGYNWADPRHWTENDNAVLQTLLKFPKSLIPQLRTEYAKLYNSSLQADLQKLLGSYDQVSYLFM